MSSNFINLAGSMAGMDMHLYFTVAPPAVPVPVPDFYEVFSLHISFNRLWRVVLKVTTDSLPVTQSSWAMLVVPHIPVPLGPPHPAAEPAEIAVLWGTSNSSPQLSVHSVTAGGSPLLTEILWAIGGNLNCGMFVLPCNIDLNPNSVKTSPTLGDYAQALVGCVLSGIYGAVMGAVMPQTAPSIALFVMQNVADIADSRDSWVAWVLDPVTKGIGELGKVVQKAVDGSK